MTATKQKLLIVPSKAMDKNDKEENGESGRIRFSKTGREKLRVKISDALNVKSASIKDSVTLEAFYSFVNDVKRIKGETNDNVIVGFVTSSTFNKLFKGSNDNHAWLEDSEDREITIGSDPEFILRDNNGNIIHAQNYLSHTGELGCDGAMAEIRPKPAQSVEALVDNIRDIFKKANDNSPIKPFEWISGCYYKGNNRDYPLGGHIHFGNPARIGKLDNTKKYNIFKVVNRILDELVAVPLIKFDGIQGHERRCCSGLSPYGGYGFLGEWRLCGGRLEYRTLSGMWLIHPILATAVIGTAYAIMDEIYRLMDENNFNYNYVIPKELRTSPRSVGENRFFNDIVYSKDFDSWAECTIARDMGCTESNEELIKKLNSSDRRIITGSFINKWYKKLSNMKTYKNKSKYIELLAKLMECSIDEFDGASRSIKENWLVGKKFLTLKQ